MRLVGLPPVAEEAVYCVQVSLGGRVDHVRVRRLADVLSLRQLVLDANRYLAEGVDSRRYAAKTRNRQLAIKKTDSETENKLFRVVLTLGNVKVDKKTMFTANTAVIASRSARRLTQLHCRQHACYDGSLTQGANSGRRVRLLKLTAKIRGMGARRG